MKGIVRLALLSVLMVVVCPAFGCVYMNVTRPLDTDLHETQVGSKVGHSQAQSILGLVAWGDAGTKAAAEAGGITTLQLMDQNTLAILGIVYVRSQTIVYGD